MNMKEALQKIASETFSTIAFDVPASEYTSMGVGGPIACVIFPSTEEALSKIVAFLSASGIAYYPIGNWTNTIVTDDGIADVIISLTRMTGSARWPLDYGLTEIVVRAGTPLRDVVSTCSDILLAGMEFCAGIPGTVGGAIKMNAGAFGKEIKDVVSQVVVMDANGKMEDIPVEDMNFSYRSCDLPEGYIIVSASVLLGSGYREKIDEAIAMIMKQRREKHPLEYRSAGSVFKNQNGIVAGKLIEELGLKGTRIGGAQISEKHGNFIVNVEGAKCNDIIELIEVIKQAAKDKRGVTLETEIKIIGT